MKTSSSSAASTLTYESDTSAPLHSYRSEEARLFDLVLKKLETVRVNSGRDDEGRRDGERGGDARCMKGERRGRRQRGNEGAYYGMTSRDDLDESDDCCGSARHSRDGWGDSAYVRCERESLEEKLPAAILKLDKRHAIPRVRMKNDVLVEIEACTIEKRSQSTRPGIRSSLNPKPIETISVDCIGRVVHLSNTHTRSTHNVALEDRIAALYPFEYCGNGDVSGMIGKRKGLGRYALVDAGYVVTVPKHVDGAQAACLIRLYTTAFQSIQLGILHTNPTHNRYDVSQLSGISILVQAGHTELGMATIDLATALGAHQIFATAPSEYHNQLRRAGAIPLGDQTFRWELFLTEKLGLVLLQDMPSAENFEHFLRLLDDEMGVMVKINPWPQWQRQQEQQGEEDVVERNLCEGFLSVHDVADLVRCSFEEAKFQLRVACCPSYVTYNGVWSSSKEDPILWKEDLTYLMNLLGEKKLNPRIGERICLEDFGEAQDNIELYGKSSSIVCLPFETKNESSAGPTRESAAASTRLDETTIDIPDYATSNNLDYAENFAIDSGYVLRSQVDALSDFHRMNDSRKQPNATYYNSSPKLDYALDYDGLKQNTVPQFTLEEHRDYVSPPVSINVESTDQRQPKESTSGPRRSRIIQRIKSQQKHNTSSDCDRNALSLAKSKNARTQWRKLRRDARAKSQANEHIDQEPTEDEGIQFANESTGIFVDEHAIGKPTSENIDKLKQDERDTSQVVGNKACSQSNAQSLIQHYSSGSPQNPHHRWSTTHEERREKLPKPIQGSEKFQSLMSKWKSIESSGHCNE